MGLIKAIGKFNAMSASNALDDVNRGFVASRLRYVPDKSVQGESGDPDGSETGRGVKHKAPGLAKSLGDGRYQSQRNGLVNKTKSSNQ